MFTLLIIKNKEETFEIKYLAYSFTLTDQRMTVRQNNAISSYEKSVYMVAIQSSSFEFIEFQP
jgi:hypothetical protein